MQFLPITAANLKAYQSNREIHFDQREKIIHQKLSLKMALRQISDKDFKTSVLMMCKELKDSMEEVKKTMCEQNGSAVEEIENPRR